MARLADLLNDIPKRLRPRFERGIVAGAKSLDDELQRTLGVQGTRSSPSTPGTPPRRQSGTLQAGTKAFADPSDLTIRVVTTSVGIILDRGTRDGRIKARPWKVAALERNLPDRRRHIYGG